MKSKRQEKILELIADHSVQTQEQLLAELNEAGFSTTQATISRDIKQLRIIKELGRSLIHSDASSTTGHHIRCSCHVGIAALGLELGTGHREILGTDAITAIKPLTIHRKTKV